MPKIIPISELRNYKTALKSCDDGEIIYITKNGFGKYAVLPLDYFEKLQAKVNLIAKLDMGATSVTTIDEWLSLTEVRKEIGDLKW